MGALQAASAMRAGLEALGMAAADVEAPCLLPAASTYCLVLPIAYYPLPTAHCISWLLRIDH